MNFFTNKLKKILPWFSFYLAVFFLALNISYSYLDYDLGWHLQVGKTILENKSVPHINTDLNIIGPIEWVDHEWLLNLGNYYIFNNFGYLALNIIYALLLCLFVYLVQVLFYRFYLEPKLSNKKSKDISLYNRAFFIFSSLSFFAVIAMSPFIGIRFQIFGNILFVLLLLILAQASHKTYLYLWWLSPLFIAWVNLHGSFLIGIAVMWIWLFYVLVSKFFRNSFFAKYFYFELLQNKIRIFVFVLVASFSTLINPYGIKLFSFLKDYSNTLYMKKIVEWRSFYELPILYNEFLYTAIFACALSIIGLNIFLKNKNSGFLIYIKKINAWYFFLGIFFFLMSLKSKRHFPLFFVTSLPLLLQFIYFEFSDITKTRAFEITNKYLKILSTIIFFILSIYYFININFVTDPFDNKYCAFQPCKVFSFVQALPDYQELNILNEYSWGGYMLWKDSNKGVFIDGRMPQLSMKGSSILEEYLSFFDTTTNQEKLDEYDIDLIILKKEAKLKLSKLEQSFLDLNPDDYNYEEENIVTFLNTSSLWSKVYEDSISLVYLKNL